LRHTLAAISVFSPQQRRERTTPRCARMLKAGVHRRPSMNEEAPHGALEDALDMDAQAVDDG